MLAKELKEEIKAVLSTRPESFAGSRIETAAFEKSLDDVAEKAFRAGASGRLMQAISEVGNVVSWLEGVRPNSEDYIDLKREFEAAAADALEFLTAE